MGFGIFIEVTNGCNLSCKTCLPKSGMFYEKELSETEIINFLSKLQKHGANSVFFTGGEPFIRKDFLSILKKANNLGLSIGVLTNGTLLDNPSIITTLKNLDVHVNISLDGSNSQINDEIRGKGAFDRVIKTVKKLIQSEIHLELSFTINKKNFKDILGIAKLTKDLNCKRIHLTQVVNRGRASINWEELSLLDEQKKALFSFVQKASKTVFGLDKFNINSACWIDKSSIYVDCLGNLYSCTEISQESKDFAALNIKNAPVEEILKVLNKDFSNYDCCYKLYNNSKVSFIKRADAKCPILRL